MNLQENIRRILIEETEVIPTFMLRRINKYVNNILLLYDNYNLQGTFKNLIDEIADVIINDLLSDYIDSIGYTVDDEDDNYDQSVVDKVYDTYYNVLSEYIQGNYSDEIYKLYRKNKK
jgi:isoleucyl-tRNA synthetase